MNFKNNIKPTKKIILYVGLFFIIALVWGLSKKEQNIQTSKVTADIEKVKAHFDAVFLSIIHLK